MSASVSVDFLLRVAQASLEQQGAIESILSGEGRVLSEAEKEFTAEARGAQRTEEYQVVETPIVAGVLERIYREIAAVRKDFVELRGAKERLEKMLADRVFAFTRKVD